MSWKDLFTFRENNKPREDLVLKLLQDHATSGEVHNVEFVRGKIGGEGTYKLVVSSNYSRTNLTAIGLSESEDIKRRSGGTVALSIIEVPQKPMEAALSTHYDAKFPPARGYSGS